MKTIKLVTIWILLFAFYSCGIKNLKTESVKIKGNCGMCEERIETAGNLKKGVEVVWDVNTKLALITYDSIKTTKSEVLKRIALAGHDNEEFLAPDDVYDKLPNCCKYERDKKTLIVSTVNIKDTLNQIEEVLESETVEIEQFKSVFDSYFAVKDALVKTDGTSVSAKSKELLANLNSVKSDKLSKEEAVVWAKVKLELITDAEHMSDTKEIEHQRQHFISLSKNIYTLTKITKHETPIYYQFCPMANDGKGANWLSKENSIKNPYYGSQMLNCGKTVETIK